PADDLPAPDLTEATPDITAPEDDGARLAEEVQAPEPMDAGPDLPPEDSPPPAVDTQKEEAPAQAALPSFLSDYAAPEEPEAAPEAPADVPEPEFSAADTPEAEPAAPAPRIVDVPPDPDPDSFAASPSALTKSAQVQSLTDAQRAMLRPLLAQLTALRDQMANPRRDTR
ncbi:MAG: hypothetical protein AAFR44_08595, partial [Pseudomonadota bacterium]